VIYQVYPRSFADSDGDGMGDLPGITAHLDHLVELGVDALWLSPFYRSPMADAGYDVADYRDVDPSFGTLADADALLAGAHQRGLKVIVDLVPNHTSAQHAWFTAALAAGPGSAERELYLFRDGRGEAGVLPPNDWQSVFGGPAWTRVPDGQWYLHLFAPEQPDLNWDNPKVRAEFCSILRFWLDRGVDGFRVDVAHGLVKAPDLPDWADDRPPAGENGAQVNRAPMWDQDGVHEIYREWRSVLDSYPGQRILVAEAWVTPLDRLSRYVRGDEMNQAFNFAFLQAEWNAPAQRKVIRESLETAASVGAPTTWVLSNHDVTRHATRLALGATDTHTNWEQGMPEPDAALGLRRARAATLLMLALPGSAYLYQGEELGLPEDIWLPDEVRQDPTWLRSGYTVRGRDGCRVPLPWVADAPGYGFSPTGAAWLPQPTQFRDYALDQQRGVAGSTYELYRQALRLRRAYRLGQGPLTGLDEPAGQAADVVSFAVNGVRVLTNLGRVALPLPSGEVLIASGPLTPVDGAAGRVLPTDTTIWLS
jgi:alpha-glucosidase